MFLYSSLHNNLNNRINYESGLHILPYTHQPYFLPSYLGRFERIVTTI